MEDICSNCWCSSLFAQYGSNSSWLKTLKYLSWQK